MDRLTRLEQTEEASRRVVENLRAKTKEAYLALTRSAATVEENLKSQLKEEEMDNYELLAKLSEEAANHGHLRRELNTANIKCSKYEEKIASMDLDRTRLKICTAQLEDLKKDLSEQRKKFATERKERTQYSQTKMDSLNLENSSLKKETEDLKAENRKLKTDSDELSMLLTKLQSEHQNLLLLKDQAEREISRLKESEFEKESHSIISSSSGGTTTTTQRSNYKKMRNMAEKLRKEKADALEKIGNLEREIKDMTDDVKRLRGIVEESRKTVEKQGKELQDAKKANIELQDQLKNVSKPPVPEINCFQRPYDDDMGLTEDEDEATHFQVSAVHIACYVKLNNLILAIMYYASSQKRNEAGQLRSLRTKSSRNHPSRKLPIQLKQLFLA